MKRSAFDPNAASAPGSGLFGLGLGCEEAQVVIVPAPWDATTSYRPGTAGGPAAILAASHQVDLFDVETGRPYEAGIAMLPIPDQVVAWNREARNLAEPVIRGGGVGGSSEVLASVDRLGDRLNTWVEAQAERWLDAGKLVGLVGGDHSVPYGLIAALARRHPGLGILHVDAHADLRRAYEGFTWSHASIMYNVMTRLDGVARLVQVGIRDLCDAEHAFIQESNGRIVTTYDATLRTELAGGTTWSRLCELITSQLPPEVYVSFDIDGLDPSLCPHTGTPVPGGLSFAEATGLMAWVVRSGRRIVGFDLNEVAPGPPGDEWDANVGARVLYKLIGWTLRSRAGPGEPGGRASPGSR
jgi:agmatinase